jgi:hypothetical protein
VALAAALSTDTFRQIAAIFAQNEAKAARIETDLQWFIQGVKEKGYSSTDEFLTLTKVIKPVVTKGTRSRMDSVKRSAVEAAVKAQIKSPDEIASEFGITPDSVYSIRSKLGLTVKRKPKATTSAPPLPRTAIPSKLGFGRGISQLGYFPENRVF